MSFLDITRMCLDSLRRRKGRTVLTVLGVFIGCVSIIVMVSIGAGMKESYDHMLDGMGDVSMIEVYGGSGEAKLDDKAVSSFKEYDGVVAVIGKAGMDYATSATTGVSDRYSAGWCNVQGVDSSAMEEMGYELLEGRLPQKDDEVVVGQYFAYNFMDTLMPDGKNYRERWKWDDQGNQLDPDDPFFNPLNAKVKLTIKTYEENGKTCEIEYTVVGVLKEDYGKGYETSEGLIMDVNALKQISAEMSDTPIQSVKTEYSEIMVKAADLNMVTDIEESIKGLGYYTSSMQSMRESLEQEARQIELMLGGLGAISLLVAAIGIANTMTMSVTERTREIGIMKALGCYIRDIRLLFLMEAGSIGLIGGILGLIFSFIISIGINLYQFGALTQGFTFELLKFAIFGSPDQARISVISLPLVIFAILFSFAVGLLSGYQPANKAVKISALEAIKSSAQ